MRIHRASRTAAVHGGEPWIVLSPEHAEILHDAGYSKLEVKRRRGSFRKCPRIAWRRKTWAARALRARPRLGEIGPDTRLTIAHEPNDIAIIVAGGPGAHTVYIPCFGNTRSVTRAIEASVISRRL